MSLLFKHLRVHQVFGANTDVGKTLLTAALVRASATRCKDVYYLKPVSTGAPEDADDEHIKCYAGVLKHRVQTDCLYRFGEPVSPHLAAKLATESATSKVAVPSDETFVNSIATHIRKCARRGTYHGDMYVETAGGVHSPILSGTTQVDGFRPLFLPTILIGDAKLGGISSTISAYESLLVRGNVIDLVLLFREEYYRNWEYLLPYFSERNIQAFAIDAPPPRLSDAAENLISTEKYYQQIVPQSQDSRIFDALRHLDDSHDLRLNELDSMPQRTLDSIWWPFVQHGQVHSEKDVTVIDSACSDFFSVYNVRQSASLQGSGATDKYSLLEPQFDGSASWWTQTVGHAHPSLALAAARAAGRYGHVMFPQATHLPALKLAERLVHDGPGKGWASRAFISDNGSTGMEVALKMALRAFSKREGLSLEPIEKKKLGVLGLKGSYHGDTIGVMDACEEGVYTCEWHDAKGFWFEPPSISLQRGNVVVTLPDAITGGVGSTVYAESLSWAYNIPRRLTSPLAATYRDYIVRTLRNLQQSGGPKLAALVLEPFVMGAGGMIFVDPLFQRILIDVVRGASLFSSTSGSGLPVIFDEVFVGLYRIGMQSSGPLLGVNPDISVNAKVLTGGLVPLSVTMASDDIFQAFLGKSKIEALLHGHSYTAYAVGCEVANETLDIIQKLTTSNPWITAQAKWAPSGVNSKANTVWSFWDPQFVNAISHLTVVSEVMTLGTVLVIKVLDKDAGYGSQAAQTVLQTIRHRVDSDSAMSPAPGGAAYGVHFRTLGDVGYFMTSLNTPSSTIRSVEDKIWDTLRQLSENPSRQYSQHTAPI